MDDRRAGLVIRALRRRRGWRQADLANASRTSQSLISRVERGHLGTLSLDLLRQVLRALEIRGDLDLRWRGGQLDRLIDQAHAKLGTAVATTLARLGWQVVPEVTFARLGERGSIDLLGVKEAERAAIVIELKSELTSYEETQRRFDVKMRVAAAVVEERFGWRPRSIAFVLVLRDTSSNRDRIARLGSLLDASFPLRNVAIARWLKLPSGRVAGLWFVRDRPSRTTKCESPASHRVRVPSTDRRRAVPSVAQAPSGSRDP